MFYVADWLGLHWVNGKGSHRAPSACSGLESSSSLPQPTSWDLGWRRKTAISFPPSARCAVGITLTHLRGAFQHDWDVALRVENRDRRGRARRLWRFQRWQALEPSATELIAGS